VRRKLILLLRVDFNGLRGLGFIALEATACLLGDPAADVSGVGRDTEGVAGVEFYSDPVCS
jgi:hypothetical protein